MLSSGRKLNLLIKKFWLKLESKDQLLVIVWQCVSLPLVTAACLGVDYLLLPCRVSAGGSFLPPGLSHSEDDIFRARGCPCVVKCSLLLSLLISTAKLWCIKTWNSIGNKLTSRAFYLVWMCVLVYSYFGKNLFMILVTNLPHLWCGDVTPIRCISNIHHSSSLVELSGQNI
jgi:hypothetical protein